MEPCAGSGAMLLAIVRTFLHENMREDLARVSFYGVDLDSLCAKMKSLQLVGNNFIHQTMIGEIAIFQGNSLGPLSNLTPIYHFRTEYYSLLLEAEIIKDTLGKRAEKKISTTNPALTYKKQHRPGEQMNLFDIQL